MLGSLRGIDAGILPLAPLVAGQHCSLLEAPASITAKEFIITHANLADFLPMLMYCWFTSYLLTVLGQHHDFVQTHGCRKDRWKQMPDKTRMGNHLLFPGPSDSLPCERFLSIKNDSWTTNCRNCCSNSCLHWRALFESPSIAYLFSTFACGKVEHMNAESTYPTISHRGATPRGVVEGHLGSNRQEVS